MQAALRQLNGPVGEVPIDFSDEAQAYAACEYLARCAVPIVACHADGRLGAIQGTGTLFRIANRTILVSACHVLDDPKQRRLVLPTGEGPAPLWGRLAALDGADRDEADFAFIALEDRIAEAAARHYTVLSVTDLLRLGHEPMRGLFLLCGFPRDTTDVNDPRSLRAPLIYRTGAFSGTIPTDPTLLPVDPDVHFLLHLDRSEVLDRSRPARPAYELLAGISGCSVWAMTRSLDDATWSPAACLRVFAIETSVLDGKWLRCTHWGNLATAIAQAFPDTADVLKAHFLVAD